MTDKLFDQGGPASYKQAIELYQKAIWKKRPKPRWESKKVRWPESIGVNDSYSISRLLDIS